MFIFTIVTTLVILHLITKEKINYTKNTEVYIDGKLYKLKRRYLRRSLLQINKEKGEEVLFHIKRASFLKRNFACLPFYDIFSVVSHPFECMFGLAGFSFYTNAMYNDWETLLKFLDVPQEMFDFLTTKLDDHGSKRSLFDMAEHWNHYMIRGKGNYIAIQRNKVD